MKLSTLIARLSSSFFLPFFNLNNDKVLSSETNQEFCFFFFQINLHNEDQNETRKVIKADFSFDDKKANKSYW